mmetsp:Transcript_22528/g.60055  ORF Transcript_22528/g.60055 Transcript_22528/m.60055 type:complete len:202 (+) Transcript_22528:133-738(+)
MEAQGQLRDFVAPVRERVYIPTVNPGNHIDIRLLVIVLGFIAKARTEPDSTGVGQEVADQHLTVRSLALIPDNHIGEARDVLGHRILQRESPSLQQAKCSHYRHRFGLRVQPEQCVSFHGRAPANICGAVSLEVDQLPLLYDTTHEARHASCIHLRLQTLRCRLDWLNVDAYGLGAAPWNLQRRGRARCRRYAFAGHGRDP